jgi:flagellar motility protein MotE (MotC chaperone)
VSDWKRIKAEYVTGGTSYRKLAEKYDVSLTTLQRYATKEKWTELRKQAEVKSDTKIVESVSTKNAKIDDKYYRLVDKLFDKAEEVIDSTPVWQPTTIKEMATAIKYLKECKGLKSDADMREQEARIAKLQREAEENNPDTQKDIVVRIEGGVNDAWQK